MDFIVYVSRFIFPLLIFYIVGCGLLARAAVYDSFIKGAREGLSTVARLVSTLVGLMIATGILRASGFLDLAGGVLEKYASSRLFPAPLFPLVILRMFSSSAATGLLLDIYREYGTDSYPGLAASLIMCCTETIFYTMSVYFMTAGIKKTRHTLCGALIATFAGIAASLLLAAGM